MVNGGKCLLAAGEVCGCAICDVGECRKHLLPDFSTFFASSPGLRSRARRASFLLCLRVIDFANLITRHGKVEVACDPNVMEARCQGGLCRARRKRARHSPGSGVRHLEVVDIGNAGTSIFCLVMKQNFLHTARYQLLREPAIVDVGRDVLESHELAKIQWQKRAPQQDQCAARSSLGVRVGEQHEVTEQLKAGFPHFLSVTMRLLHAYDVVGPGEAAEETRLANASIAVDLAERLRIPRHDGLPLRAHISKRRKAERRAKSSTARRGQSQRRSGRRRIFGF